MNKTRKEQMIKKWRWFVATLSLCMIISGCTTTEKTNAGMSSETIAYAIKNVPKFTNEPYVELNNNIPEFTKNQKKKTKSFEKYSRLDSLGRCGVAYANIGRDIMPTENRGAIGMIKPSGWHTVKYAGVVEGNYLYNRCHLIGYQLSGENANTRNLITGTRYMNTEGMLPFENMVDDYVDATGNHVLYRVTPIYKGKNLVASGVQMEGWSVEDKGAGICFNVYVYNNQPGVIIDYATGASRLSNSAKKEAEDKVTESKKETGTKYILNTNTKKFHRPTCSSAGTISLSNKEVSKQTRAKIISRGYDPCKRCNP
jgi:DNA-entry nuclease